MFAPLEIGLVMGLIIAWAVLALALAFRLFDFPDLTIEGSVPLGAAIFAVTIKNGFPLSAALGASLISGLLTGALTGFLHSRFKLNKFLTGIIVVSMSYSICLRIMGASNIGLLQAESIFDIVAPLDNIFGQQFHLGTILLISFLITVGCLFLYFFFSSKTGIRLRAAGSNPDYAKSLGINVSINIIVGLAITNSLASFAGAMLASYQGFADISLGQGILILALVAMTLGERILPEEKLSYQSFVILSAVVGSIIYQVLMAYALRLGFAPTDLKLATAIFVLFVVAFRFSKTGGLLTEGV